MRLRVAPPVHIFAGEVVNGDLDQSKLDKLTIDVDPDCEFIWTDDALNKARVHSLAHVLTPPLRPGANRGSVACSSSTTARRLDPRSF
jgi:hypothetical protein